MSSTKLINGKDKSQFYKDLLIKKIKDRKRIKGPFFSYNKSPSFFNHSHIQKILYKTYYECSKKIFKENMLKFALEDYKELKENISSFEQKYKNEKKNNVNVKNKNFAYNKINYTNLHEIFSEFLRDKKKHNNNINSIIKSKIKLENINRNIRKNRINSILEKVTLNSNKIKTRVDTGKEKKEINEKLCDHLIGLINQSREKLNKTKKTLYKIDNTEKYKNQKYIIKTYSNYDIRRKIKNEEEIKIKKQKYFDLYNGLGDNNKENNEGNKENYSKNKKTKERPISFSRNRNQMKYYFYNTTSADKNIINKRLIKSAFKRESNKIVDKPLYTAKIEDILNEYSRIKKKCKLSRIKYKENHLLTYREIDNIINIKEDLLVFKLKQKYFEKRFPKPIIKRKNKRELFIKQFKDDIEFLDNKNLRNFILMNYTK